MTLQLPVLDASIRQRFEQHSSSERLNGMAHQLATAGILTGDHLKRAKPIGSPRGSTILDVIRRVLEDYCHSARPNPLARDLKITLTDDASELSPVWERYAKPRGLPYDKGFHSPEKEVQLSAFVLGCNLSDGHAVVTIGPVLNALEEAMPRLGQTVLAILDKGLEAGPRALTPGTAHRWASWHYWRGEMNEDGFLQEELAELMPDHIDQWKQENPGVKLTDEIKAEIQNTILQEESNIFSYDNLTDDIDAKWHLHRKPLPQLRLPEKLPVIQRHKATLPTVFADKELRDRWPAILAACDRLNRLRRGGKLNSDSHACEMTDCQITPYILRMDYDDCLTRIYDDTINHFYECGELDLSTNAVFLFHDLENLLLAWRRLHRYLELTQACEDLIRLLTIDIKDQKKL